VKVYLAVIGSVFGLLVIIHVWRIVVEQSVLHNPWFLLITVVAAALSIWSWRLFLVARRAP
jgi:hypothetical protein